MTNMHIGNVINEKKSDFFFRALLFSLLVFGLATVYRTNNPTFFPNLFCLVSGVVFTYSIFNLIEVTPKNLWLRIFSILFIGWSLFSVLRSLQCEVGFFKDMLTSLELFLPFLFPLLFFSRESFKRALLIVKFLIILDICYLLFSILFYKQIINSYSFDFMEVLNKVMAYANGFLLLTLHYYPRKIKWLVVIVYILSLYFAVIQARRNQILMLTIFFLFSFLLYLLRYKAKLYKKVLFAIVGLCFFFISGYFLFLQYQDTIFKKLVSRGIEDTRSFVVDEYWADMDTGSFIFGRGMNGKYYCPALFGLDTDGHRMRSGLETGYLYLILKFGLIGFLLFLSISLGAIFKGIFFSKNYFVKASALFILIYLIEQYPAGNPLFTFRLFMVWASTHFCYMKWLREVEENTMQIQFKHLKIFSNF